MNLSTVISPFAKSAPSTASIERTLGKIVAPFGLSRKIKREAMVVGLMIDDWRLPIGAKRTKTIENLQSTFGNATAYLLPRGDADLILRNEFSVFRFAEIQPARLCCSPPPANRHHCSSSVAVRIRVWRRAQRKSAAQLGALPRALA